MKKTLFVALVIVAVMLLGVSSAFAAGYRIEAGYVADDAAHSGYGATTNACKACHDVHGAQNIDQTTGAVLATSSTNLKLYRWNTTADGCVACHQGTAALTTVGVYDLGTVNAEHTITAVDVPDGDNANIAGGSNATLDCFDCHNAAPHGVAGLNGAVAAVGNGLIAGYDLSTNAGVNSYCGTKCHNLNDKVGETTTHSLVGADATHAFLGAESCYKCHTSESLSNEDFPHQDAADYVFLGTAASTFSATTLDPKCVSCHISGANGVGLTY